MREGASHSSVTARCGDRTGCDVRGWRTRPCAMTTRPVAVLDESGKISCTSMMKFGATTPSVPFRLVRDIQPALPTRTDRVYRANLCPRCLARPIRGPGAESAHRCLSRHGWAVSRARRPALVRARSVVIPSTGLPDQGRQAPRLVLSTDENAFGTRCVQADRLRSGCAASCGACPGGFAALRLA